MKDFSRKWFKARILEFCMTLCEDDVPNVRRKFCLLLSKLKQTLSLPEDDYKLSLIDNAVQKLLQDEDRDVRDSAKQVR